MLGETVTIVRSVAGTDAYDDEVYDASSDHIEVTGCAVAPRYRNENNDNREAVIIGVSVFLPAGTDVRPTDRLIIRGDTYEVEGLPGEWLSPFTGARYGVEAAATRTTG